MHQDATWYGGRPPPGPHCARWRPSSPKKGAQPPIFGPCLLWLKGWMDQDATWYGGRPRPRRHCVRWGPSSPRGTAPNFRPMHVYCGHCRPSQLLLNSCLFVYEIFREPLNGFALNSQGRRVSSLAWTSLKVKVTTDKKRPLRGPACGLCLVKHL